MTDSDELAARFEADRGRLQQLAYRMLGSRTEADDAVQLTWLRLARQDVSQVHDLAAWLTTVTSRVCLDLLRSRNARKEQPLDVHVPEPIVTVGPADPEEQAVLADSVGLALLLVLDTLSPAERLAFVLHDVFAVPFDDIGSILDRSSAAAKQLASRARRRVQSAVPPTGSDRTAPRMVVDAFLAAARDGDFDGLLAILHPDVVLRADAGAGPLGPSRHLTGRRAVAQQAQKYRGLAEFARHVLVNGTPGLVAAPGGRVVAVIGFVVRDGRITQLAILADPDRLARLELPTFEPHVRR